MLAQNTTTMSRSFPPFMSVYGSEDTKVYEDGLPSDSITATNDQEEQSRYLGLGAKPLYGTAESIPGQFDRRNSLTSGISCSSESSPTTTSSTFDSPTVAEMPGSPSSSPESASSAAPPKCFRPGAQPMAMTFNDAFPLYHATTVPQPNEEQKRNVKNLTLDMKLPNLLRPATSTGVENSLQPFSAPTSPLKETLKSGRRKPTNLTIRTPGFNQLAFPRLGDAPPTPGQRTLLHQPLSSPSLPSLISPTLGPAGGLRFNMPTIAQRIQPALAITPDTTLPMSSSLPDLRDDEYQPPKSQEAPEPGYTEGPVKIYDSGVYLYLEPTAEEASRFDTVINCAKEIKDPFERNSKSETIMSIWRNNESERNSERPPPTATSEGSFRSAFEWPSPNDINLPTPTTPKASLDVQLKQPEYLHVPWDHNSEILEDLYPLCEIIDERVKDGRKVLIHCQLGVSRSASLIIAYGLYKGYQADFHSMYMAVKQRSRWVGPNMSLIYQLTDFRSKCAKGDYPKQSKTANPSWFLHSYDNPKTPTAAVMPARASVQQVYQPSQADVVSTLPMLGGEKPPLRLNKELPPVPPSGSSSPTLNTTIAHDVALPSTNELPQLVKRSVSRPLALRSRNEVSSPMYIPPHRPNRLQALGNQEPKSFMDLARQDVPDSPSLFSPRATEFVASPFGIKTAGDLVTTAPKRIRPPPGAFPGGSEWRQSLRQSMDLSQGLAKLLSNDPRSPHQAAEAREIIRSIDDVL